MRVKGLECATFGAYQLSMVADVNWATKCTFLSLVRTYAGGPPDVR
jgi:hypothetical protein